MPASEAMGWLSGLAKSTHSPPPAGSYAIWRPSLGVSERTLYYSQRARSDIAEALEQGRAEHARRLVAKVAAAIAAERQAASRAAQEVKALLGVDSAPTAPPSPPPRSALPVDALQELAGGRGGMSPYQPHAETPSAGEYGDPLAEALPLDDPLARS